MTRARDLANFVSNAQGDVRFDTDTLFIDSSANRVGIGTTTPSEKITIQSGNLNFMGGTNDAQFIKFGDTGDDDIGSIFYFHGNNNMVFTTNASEAMRINNSGDVGIKTTSPVAPLHVDSDNDFGNILLSRDGGAGGRRPFGIGITGSADADLTISASADTDQAGAFDSDRVEIVRFLSDGYVTMPSQPFIMCVGSTNGSAGYTAGSVINHWSNQGTPIGITRSGGRFTVPVSGKYQFNSNLYSYVSSAGHYRVFLAINGNPYALSQLEVTAAGMVASPYDHTLNFSIILNLAANDYVELKVDGAQDFYAGGQHNNLSMFLLG